MLHGQVAVRWVGLTKTEAEEALDWLERGGYREVKLCYHHGHGFFLSAGRGRILDRGALGSPQDAATDR
jgi:hypothetical protein